MNVTISLNLTYQEAVYLAEFLPQNMNISGEYPSDKEVKSFETLYEIKQKLCDSLNIEVYDAL